MAHARGMMDGIIKKYPEMALQEAIDRLQVTLNPTHHERGGVAIGYTTLLAISARHGTYSRWEGNPEDDTTRRRWAARYACERQVVVTGTETLEKMGYPLAAAKQAAWPLAYALVAAQWPQLADVCPSYSPEWVREVLAVGKRNDTRTLDEKMFSARAEYLWAGGFAPAD